MKDADWAADITEIDANKRKYMYEELQREFQKTSPFAIMFQKTEQTGRKSNVQNLNLGGAITAISY